MPLSDPAPREHAALDVPDWTRVRRSDLPPTLRDAFDAFAETRSAEDAMACVRDLVRAFGGNVVSISGLDLLKRQHQVQGIRDALDRGLARRRIAQRYGVSLRTVERVAQGVGRFSDRQLRRVSEGER